MLKIKHITQYLETIAPRIYQESYDNAGLIVGNPNAECTKALICLDAIESVIDEAIDIGANLVIAHHPIVFKGLKSFTGRNYVERVIIKAIKNDIAIYAMHTNLDNVYAGVNRKICEKLGLQNCQILQPKTGLLKKMEVLCPVAQSDVIRQTLLEAGADEVKDFQSSSFNVLGVSTFNAQQNNPIGVQNGQIKITVCFPIHTERKLIRKLRQVHPHTHPTYYISELTNAHQQIGSGMIGELETPLSEEDFLVQLKDNMQTECIRYTALLRKKVRKVAVCGGAGDFLLETAKAKGAAVFVTADLKYHRFFDADRQIVIADIGHYESEQFTAEIFQSLLQKKFSTFAVSITKINTNPVRYL